MDFSNGSKFSVAFNVQTNITVGNFFASQTFAFTVVPAITYILLEQVYFDGYCVDLTDSHLISKVNAKVQLNIFTAASATDYTNLVDPSQVLQVPLGNVQTLTLTDQLTMIDPFWRIKVGNGVSCNLLGRLTTAAPAAGVQITGIVRIIGRSL